MRVDVNAFLGDYPFHPVPGGTPSELRAAMDRVGTDVAWVSHLGAIFWRDPPSGNRDLFEACEGHSRLRPVPAVHPALPRWEHALREAVDLGAPAVRSDPTRYGIEPTGPAMRALAAACGEASTSLLLSVRLEDGRQRHPDDRTAELEPWAVRALVRADPRVRLLITHADRDFVEQVHFGSTPEEASRMLWDVCWLWGPPEDHLALLLETVGVERLVFGTGMPLRIPEASVAKLDLLDLTPEQRRAIEATNLD